MCLVIHNYTRFFIACQPPFCKIVHMVHTPPYSCLLFRQLHNTCAYGYWQLLLWLTINLPNLCISVYTYLRYPPVAPARPPASARICPWIGALCGCSVTYVLYVGIMRGKTLGFLRVSANLETVMVSVAIQSMPWNGQGWRNSTRCKMPMHILPPPWGEVAD